MTDIQREIHLLIAIAKIDADLNAFRNESASLPEQIAKIEKQVQTIDNAMGDAEMHLEEMQKEKRSLESGLDDSAEKIKKLKTQLMSVQNNKEYTAMTHEIQHLEKGIDQKEERLLMLMDELDQQVGQTGDFRTSKNEEKAVLVAEKGRRETRLEEIGKEMARLEAEKPKVLAELDPQLKKKYDRILAKLHDFAVTHVVDEVCQGCFRRIPPQFVLEVKKNDQIITCQACGRILVHYTT
jgi:predicted  nucleic acid-binding Zn-ribbon protein